jgi:hypothetical protein
MGMRAKIGGGRGGIRRDGDGNTRTVDNADPSPLAGFEAVAEGGRLAKPGEAQMGGRS